MDCAAFAKRLENRCDVRRGEPKRPWIMSLVMARPSLSLVVEGLDLALFGDYLLFQGAIVLGLLGSSGR